ncbi:myotubularin-related protein 3 isoform X2 [Teleopsis dalmanni]|uniref:myotubularin-related protein 3 isoform X2 n=1 Tax=Teleopsis dalmanni TaxID=139649 RepID=UPI0018CCE08D|nr:myotubularin-related protein 3 isoform X2 [Teleopsis dalmanni]
MEGSDGSPPQSLCMIRAAELFPKQQMEKEDTQLVVPFQELAGESVRYLGRTDDGVLALSNYRIFLLKNSNNSETSVPLGLIESAQCRDLFHLIINCKDASTVKCSFETAEQCSEWQRRIQNSVGIPETLESLFAFPFYSWTYDSINCGNSANNGSIENPPSSVCSAPDYSERLQRSAQYEEDFMREVERLGFDVNGSWRISNANADFKLCPSYPQKILVPCCISDDTLNIVANFRGSRRLPAVVWRHRRSGAVIARCSQPEVGWLGWRNAKDEQLLKALADACAFDRGEQSRRLLQTKSGNCPIPSGENSPTSPDDSHEEVAFDEVRKVLIVDARSYTSAVTNRARGGGCECIEYYPCAEIEFMNLGNIHVIRKSFHALRQLCASPADVPNWLTLLEKTMWLQHLSGLLTASMTVCHAIEKKGRPVLVHCSDGWDRTPQIVATAQLCLDPFYRTVEGFRVLVEREWLSFGHKFADRCGHGPGSDELNERCPVFLQWLDLVHQLHKQFPCSFEFSMGYLIKLAQHSLSCLFGTFLCNTLKERVENSVFERTFSVWPFLSGSMYKNPLYMPNKEKVLWPAHNVRDLYLWTEVYWGSLGNQNSIDFPSCNVDGLNGSISPMAKTRSYGDLISAGIIQNGLSRRSSDPNMTVDPNLIIGSSSENDSIADMQSEREDSPDIIANFIHDTTRKLQNLTTELNNPDEEVLNIRQKIDKLNVSESETNENYEETMQKLVQHQQQMLQHQQSTDILLNTNNQTHITLTNDSTLLSSPQVLHLNTKNCELDTISHKYKDNDMICAPSSSIAVLTSKTELQDALDSCITDKTVSTCENICNKDNIVNTTNILEIVTNGATNETKPLVNVDLLRSVDLGANSNSDSQNGDNMWHGSVNTSTDTLVPIENSQQNITCKQQLHSNSESHDITDGNNAFSVKSSLNNLDTTVEFIKEERKSNDNNSTNSKILPKVHTPTCRPNALLNSLGKTTNLPSSVDIISDNADKNVLLYDTSYGCKGAISTDGTLKSVTQIPATNSMDESILILPEHQKLEISVSGKCETIPSNGVTVATSNTPNSYYNTTFTTTSNQQRRRRTSSSNSRREAFFTRQINGSTNSRFSLPGVRSLPMTPPGLPERAQIALSCPDGLAHALSEQNIRLQQIVHEHKLREDVLLREIHDMRMALLKKVCPNCNNAATAANEEQCSALDNVENASICSWEAVEDRSGPSSCASSSIQPNATSVLWVPDHAVSRCTSCQTEFWLGRRKHHCRSCGQIFCADCSEFWAPLPDEKLFSPVRLCGPCYHSVTTRMQQVNQYNNAALLQLEQSTAKAAGNGMGVSMAATPSPPSATSKA